MTGTPVTIGIDIGTSGAKGIAVAADGRVCARATAGYPLLTPKPGWTEQRPEDWWQAVVGILRRITATPGLEVQGLGLSGQMHGAVFVDDKGAPIRPALLWNDGRSGAQGDEIERRLGRERVIAVTGNRASAAFQATKVLWLKANEPEAFGRIAHVLLPKDFIRLKLTGDLATDAADASGTLFLDLATRRYSEDMLRAVEVKPDWLPQVHEGPEVTGRISAQAAADTGLAEGTPVVAGGGDNACAAIGAGVVAPGIGACSIGTSGTVFVHADRPVHDPQGALNGFCAAVPGGWHLMGVILSAGGALSWFKERLAATEATALGDLGVDVFTALLDQAMSVPAGADGLTFLPYLAGERSPHMDPAARGAWIGLSLAHGRAHLTRALIEGVGFAMADCVDRIRAQGLEPERLALVGGGARHPGWRRLLAAQMRAPLLVRGAEEGPALGAAILAQVGTGMASDFAAAIAALVPPSVATEEPDQDLASRYQPLLERYQTLYPALKSAGAFAA